MDPCQPFRDTRQCPGTCPGVSGECYWIPYSVQDSKELFDTKCQWRVKDTVKENRSCGPPSPSCSTTFFPLLGKYSSRDLVKKTLCCSIANSYLTLCNPMDCSTPGFPLFSLCPRVCSDSCPLSWWYHPAISSSVLPFSRLQSLPASESFPMSQFLASGGQSIGVSVSVLPVNIQDWFPFRWMVGSPWSPRDSQESSPTPQFKSINSLVLSFIYSPTLTSIQ